MVCCAGVVNGVAERERLVAGTVVSLDGLDGDPELTEPAVRSLPERSGSVTFLVRKDFAVGESGVAVDRGVHERVSDLGGPMLHDVASPVGAPPTARWDPSELLHVDLDELARPVLDDLSADHCPRGAVHPDQPVQALAAQHSMHRRGRHPDDPRNARGTELAGPA